jgi:long-chain acyl-CoA synthetase
MIALQCGDEIVNYTQLEASVRDFTQGLKQLITKTQRVGIFLDNSFEYVVAYLSVIRAGGIVVPFNTQLKEEITKTVDDCEPSFIITNSKYTKRVSKYCKTSQIMMNDVNFSLDTTETFTFFGNRDYNDVVMILYTSGTTGKPKGVTLTRGNIEENANSIIEYLKLSYKDKGLACLPFFYAYGNSLLTTHLLCRGTLVIPKSSLVYPPTLVKELQDLQITGFAGVPSTFTILLPHLTEKMPHLRYVTQAGGHMTHTTAKALKEALPNTDIIIMYGQTEATARLTYLPPEDIVRKPGSIGKAIPGVTLSIYNEELVAKGGNITMGYWKDPVETNKVIRKDKCNVEWLFTGDLAYQDTEGYFYLIGRKSEMIKVSGYRVSPLEIEEVISTYSGIKEVAVVGLPDERAGQKIVAVIVGENIDEKELRLFCSKKMANYKVPSEVKLVVDLPKTASGKVNRNMVRLGAIAT